MSKASFAILWRGGALALAMSSVAGCKKDEPPPPLPQPQVVETAEAPLELRPEDAGPPVQAEKPAPKRTTSAPSGLQRCCAALRQNAASAPEPTKGYMSYAASACDVAAAQGKDKASIVGQLTAALKGAGLPAECK